MTAPAPATLLLIAIIATYVAALTADLAAMYAIVLNADLAIVLVTKSAKNVLVKTLVLVTLTVYAYVNVTAANVAAKTADLAELAKNVTLATLAVAATTAGNAANVMTVSRLAK